jgi:hypothetical protein
LTFLGIFSDRDCSSKRAILALAFTVACAPAPDQNEKTPGPAATAAALATTAWAAGIDADSARVAPVRCDLSPEIAQGALVFVQRPNDSSTKILADYRGENGRAIDSFYAMAGTVRLFVRVDEWYGNPGRVVRGTRRVDSLWFADGRVVRWVDSLGQSRSTSRRSVGARAENIQNFYDEWLRVVRNCGGPARASSRGEA